MPRMNGAQACAEILRIRPVPIVFASGSGAARDVPGVTAFLDKPFEPHALYEILAKI
jgi:CheY-like chemotaxis protein